MDSAKRQIIKENLANALNQSNYSAQEIANYLGTKTEIIKKYMRAETMPSLVDFANICILLKLNVNEILGICKKF